MIRSRQIRSVILSIHHLKPGVRGRNLRASALLLTCAVIPVVLLTGTFGYYLTVMQRQVLDEGIKGKAAVLATALSRELSTQVQLLAILSESPRLDPPLEKEEFARLSMRLLQKVPVWQTLRITSPDGSIELTTPELHQVVSSRVVDEGSHAEMVRSAKPVIGRLAIGPRGRPAFPVRVPVIRNGTVVYGLTSVIRPQALETIIRDNGLELDWVGWIADDRGSLVYSSFGKDSALTQSASNVVAAEPSQNGMSLARLADGRQVRSSSAHVAGTSWTITVGMPSTAYTSAYGQGLMVLAVTALVTVGLATAAALLFLRELGARRRDEEAVASWQRVDALGKLAGGVAHDLNNLLMVFQSGADSIARRPDDMRRTATILEAMREAVARGRTLTQRLLSFSRRSNSDAVSIRLDEQMETYRDTLIQASQELVTLSFDHKSNIWPVRVDPQSLETALINLVTNAREAMPDGGLVRVSVRNVTDLSEVEKRLAGPGVALSVSDEGVGVLPEDIHRIVEPFFTTKAEATGLGLSQVVAFARRSGGALIVNSVSGRGSVFTLLLPLDPAADEKVTEQAGPEALPRLVLVVDDTSSSLEAARQTLEDAGVRTLSANNGRTALSVLSSHSIEGVLTDIRMPGMSGLELLEQVRKTRPTLPVVLMTGFSEVVEQGHRIDAPVIMKPFDLAQLCQAFAKASDPRTHGNVVPIRR